MSPFFLKHAFSFAAELGGSVAALAANEKQKQKCWEGGVCSRQTE